MTEAVKAIQDLYNTEIELVGGNADVVDAIDAAMEQAKLLDKEYFERHDRFYDEVISMRNIDHREHA